MHQPKLEHSGWWIESHCGSHTWDDCSANFQIPL